ncbi:MAG: Na+/H+ antiporter NhaC family protein [Melioribacteraceae bacterium]|nr:Na+/H+ antiporter NhaC family protein [Melioribacteraceae bacterium]MCF8354624.1 Na+/H+ antiporter NhaC family protein [Melioribacteraceae bacterium]MCF8395012.1 Na+/H+ antiporter NhaC family protein [Melioribacteraceae bacterium]MCF8418884.1 Na+/H+ antiporter NhaC family protein [Melioribacteraceae bacterium]
MRRLKIIILFFLVFCGILSAQQVDTPNLILSDVNFVIEINNLPDSIPTISAQIFNEDIKTNLDLIISDGKVDTSISIPESGSYTLTISAIDYSESLRVIPGWFSILPPLLAILLALITRQVLVSLAAGIYIGAIFIFNYNPFAALLRLADHFILNALADIDHMYVIVFTLLIGGVVGIISSNGGTAGIANVITKKAKTARSGMLSSWFMGIIVFFDDYANSLIIGNMMRPITDKLKISREKLSYIVDSTAAPIASIVIISTWIGYELGLIDAGLKSIGSTANAYDVFIQTIPYRFYPIAAIFFVFLTSYSGRDFGPMYKAEKRARTEGKLYETEIDESKSLSEDRDVYTGSKARWYNGAVPILIILLGTIFGLVYTGINALQEDGITEYGLREIISNSDSYSSLLWSSFIASLTAIIMTVLQKIMNLHESIESWMRGIQSMMIACIILVFAWAISSVTNELKTADYLISVLSDSINPRFFPVLVFIICALTSFSTGTSWGTMAIVMPIVIPLSHKLAVVNGYSPADSMLIINGVVSSVLAGSVFGDHCSPIADTTILSSMASKCNHIDHVKTQLPYAILVGAVCMILGDIPTAFGLNPFISLALIFGVLITAIYFFGKKVPEAV